MSTIVKGLENTQEENHRFEDYICFIDSDKNVFIIGDEGMIIDISSPIFNQYSSCFYDNIEHFLNDEFGTVLLKAFSGQREFDIEIIIK